MCGLAEAFLCGVKEGKDLVPYQAVLGDVGRRNSG